MDKYINLLTNKLHNLKREQIVAILIAFILIFIGALYFWLTREADHPDIEPGSVDQPLTFEKDREVVIESEKEEIFKEVTYTELPIYDFRQVDHSNLVQSFLQDVGKGFTPKEEYDQIVYYWRENQEETFYVTEYNSILDKVFFRFKESVTPKKVGISNVSQDQLEQFFLKFAKTYWGSEMEYTNFKITPEGRSFRIEANRLIGEIPLMTSGFLDYSDYLVVENDGQVTEGLFHIFEYDKSSEVTLDLISTEDLSQVISRDDYPKEFNQRAPIGLDPSDLGYEQYENDPESEFLGDAALSDALDKIPEVESCNASRVSLAYFFLNINADKLSPVYRIDCVGKVIVNKKEYDVPVVIYASAIDPEFVYIPGNIPQ